MQTPFVWTASATGLGGRWQGGYGNLITAARAGGFSTIALMHRYATKQQVADIKAAGFACWAWDEPGAVPSTSIDGHEYQTTGLTPQVFKDFGYDGVILQTENPDQRDGALRLFRDGLALGKEKHIVTYYFGFDDGHGAEHWADFKAAGVTKVWVECYAADNHLDAKAYTDRGVECGFPREDIITLFGVYRGEFPAAYSHSETVGRTFGCYIADTWPDATMGEPTLKYWKAWGGLNKVALLAYWQVRDKAGNVLHEERATTWTKQIPVPGTSTTVSQITNGLQECLGWMEKNLDAIRAKADIELIRIQH